MMMSAQVEPRVSDVAPDIRDAALRPAEPLRILHVVPQVAMGGTEHGVLKLMKCLAAGTFDQHICAVRGYDPSSESLRSVADKIFAMNSPQSRMQVSVFRLASVMKRYRPHIVHSRNWGAIEAIPAARLARVPVAIHSEHGYELDMLHGLPWRRRVFRRIAFAMADAVFAVTKELAGYHARQICVSPDSVRVIYNGVDTVEFSPRADLRESMRARLQLPANTFAVGSVGRMVAIKDHLTLLKAAEISIRNGIDLRLILGGAGPELTRLQEYVNYSAELCSRVIFAGASAEVSALMNAFDVFALPSIAEGMSNTLLEAMACGLPVLATGVGGNPEIVEDGAHGWIFEPRDSASLARHICDLAHDRVLCEQFGKASRQRAVQLFNIEHMIEQYRNLYIELAARKCLPGSAEGAACAG
jgi:sugar transferase (PEP-CTERM/EpsH1 system associated)